MGLAGAGELHRLSIVDCRSVRHIAQGVLAHILGRLPCPKKTPRKIWNSMLAQYQYRMKIRKADNYCRIISCATKNCKNQHKFANCNAIRIYHNGKIVAEASAALRRQNKLAPQSHHTLRNNKGKITFRLHHKPGHCAISKWPGPFNALTVPLCQETWSVPENQPQRQHWLSCELKCKTREKDT